MPLRSVCSFILRPSPLHPSPSSYFLTIISAAFATCVAYGRLVFGVWKQFGLISPALKAGAILMYVQEKTKGEGEGGEGEGEGCHQ